MGQVLIIFVMIHGGKSILKTTYFSGVCKGRTVVKRMTQTYLASKIDELRQALGNTRGALHTAAKTFRRYGQLHRAKGTAEGNLKASNNDDLAEFCEGVLADYATLTRSASGEGK